MKHIHKMTKEFSEEMHKDGWSYSLVYVSMFIALCIWTTYKKIRGVFKNVNK